MSALPTINPEALVLAIADHIDGWKSATYGWQGHPDPAIEAQNRAAATQGHAAECLRRIRLILAGAPIADASLPAHNDHPLRHWDRTCPACNPDATQPIAEPALAIKSGQFKGKPQQWFTRAEVLTLLAKE